MPAVLFDMDGILIDSEPLWRESMQKVLENYGLLLTTKECMYTKGMKIDMVIDFWNKKRSMGWKNTQEIKKKIHETLIRKIRQKGKAVPGSLELVYYVRNGLGQKKGLATSSDEELGRVVSEKLSLGSLMDAMVCAGNVLKAKPEPDVYLKCTEKLKEPTHACIAMEDSFYGIISAKKAGMKVIGIPESPEEEMKFRELADMVFYSMMECYHYFRRRNTPAAHMKDDYWNFL